MVFFCNIKTYLRTLEYVVWVLLEKKKITVNDIRKGFIGWVSLKLTKTVCIEQNQTQSQIRLETIPQEGQTSKEQSIWNLILIKVASFSYCL